MSRPRPSDIDVFSDSTSCDRDEVDLARVGKNQLLKRRFGLLSITAFTCTLMGTWGGTLVTLVFGLQNGGPAGLVYSFLVTWVGNLSVAMAMGELSSMFPTAGGQYHWSHILAPKSSKKLVSYLIGWLLIISWIVSTTSLFYSGWIIIQAAVTLYNPSYQAKGWQGTLIVWAVLLLMVLITTVLGRIIPTLEIVLLLMYVLGFLGTMIPLLYFVPSGHARSVRAREVFGTFFDLGGWNSNALSFFIGIGGNVNAFIGMDGAIHMCEEVKRSSVTTARSMVTSVMISGVTGFAILLSVLFSVEDLQSLRKIDSEAPFIYVLADRFDSKNGATAIAGAIVFAAYTSSVAVMSSSSRMMWSLARDCGVPGWRWLKKIDARTSIPINTVFATAGAAALLALINIASSIAYQSVVAATIGGFYLSYLTTLSLLLFRRIRGEIGEPQQDFSIQSIDQSDHVYTWGPWRLKGWLGLLNNLLAVVYVTIVSFFSFWPTTANVTAASMNYSIVVLGGFSIGSVVWYFLQGRKQFSGPLIEVRIIERKVEYPSKDR